jgi:hypothetical protein
MNGKIDFIICEDGGSWYIESKNVPLDVAILPNAELVEWTKKEMFDCPDIVFVGVYWRDQIVDEFGLTNSETIKMVYQKSQQN